MKDVVGYEGLYWVLRDGTVWAYPKKSRRDGRLLKQSVDRYGYLYVCLFKDGTRKNLKVHRLVAQAYLVACDKPHVNHIDGNKANNSVENLEWVTPKENKQHAFRTGLTKMKPSQIEASRRNITAYNLSKGKNHVKFNSVQ
jgi:trehalose/maltose hydrolase-like predicted phosphorylase